MASDRPTDAASGADRADVVGAGSDTAGTSGGAGTATTAAADGAVGERAPGASAAVAGGSLEDLVGLLVTQIQSTDWLELNPPTGESIFPKDATATGTDVTAGSASGDAAAAASAPRSAAGDGAVVVGEPGGADAEPGAPPGATSAVAKP